MNSDERLRAIPSSNDAMRDLLRATAAAAVVLAARGQEKADTAKARIAKSLGRSLSRFSSCLGSNGATWDTSAGSGDNSPHARPATPLAGAGARVAC